MLKIYFFLLTHIETDNRWKIGGNKMKGLSIKMIHDEVSEKHSIRVSKITKILAQKVHESNPKVDVDMIAEAALYHDIGKTEVPTEVLNKPGRLSDEEFTLIKNHSAIGANIIMKASDKEPVMEMAYKIARWHHERYDGHGYPDQLVGDEIPLEAQITSVADVYDALTSERPYKKAFSSEKAISMITHGDCGCFNPKLLQCLKACKSQLCIA